MKKIAVIGSGLGGLSAAAQIASRQGFSVDLYEKEEFTGGKAGSIQLGGCRFDCGPTIVTLDFVLRRLFETCGKRMEDYLLLKPLEMNCRYNYMDGLTFDAYTDHTRFAEHLSKKGLTDKSSFLKYSDYCKTIYDESADIFLFHSFHELETLQQEFARDTAKNLHKLDTMRTMHQANRSFFTDKRLIQFLDRYATYNGSSPYKAPATLNIIQHVEQMGAYVPDGGIRQIPEALTTLCEDAGVNIKTGDAVRRIRTKNNKVTGLVTDSGTYAYDAVVSNCDVRTTYETLLHRHWSLDAVKARMSEPSSSAMVFFWPVKLESELAVHNILFSNRYKREFDDIIKKKVCPEDPTIYIYISSKYCGKDAPKGMENWYVMINAPYDTGQDWKAETTRVRARIMTRLRAQLGIELDKHIRDEKVLTPPDIAKNTGSFKGSLYGPSSNSMISAFLRQRNRSLRYPGLYFCGGSGHPGGGIPLTVLSGMLSADLLEKHS